jgi:diguanylate cyclase (GGDEF)-like protein/PAS domain S-box-containing protein
MAYITEAGDYARLLIDASQDMIISVDITLRIVEFNPAAERTFGYTKEEVLGKPIDILYANPDEAWSVRIDTFQFGANREVRNRRKCGEVFISSLRSERICNAEGEIIGSMGISREITAQKMIEKELEDQSRLLVALNSELKAANEKLHRMATTDELTDLPNRRAMIEHLSQCWARAEREGSLLSCAILDVDRFKSINDTHGHDVGDHVLREVAAMLRQLTRRDETIGRIGGEEFLLVFNCASIEAGARCAERIRSTASKTECDAPDGALRVTLSAGLAVMTERLPSIDTLLKRADEALYVAKNAGRDRLEVAPNPTADSGV